MFWRWSVINAKQLMADKYIHLLPYFKFLRVSIFILVLITIHVWLENTIATVLITHLTGINGLRLPTAASVVNVQDGLSAFLLLLVAYVSETKLGSFWTVVLTTISYAGGLLLIFSAAMEQKENLSYLFVAALFIALGRSGRDISLKEFLANQCKEEWSLDEDADEGQIESYRKIYWRIASLAGIIVSVSVAWKYKDMEWVDLCKLSAIAMGVGFAFFIAGIPFYHRMKLPQGNTVSVASKLLRAAIKKKYLNNTTAASAPASDSRHFYMDKLLRWIDRAAIIEPSPSLDEQLRQGRLHTIEQVREVKKMISLIPLWMTFLVFGLLQATASVFFFKQVDYMNPKIGLITNIPVQIFVVIMRSTSFVVSYISEKLFGFSWGYENAPRHVMLIRIGSGLAIGPICCVVAWRVESYRLEKYVKSGVSIDVVWLIPQFVLLGMLDGLIWDGLKEFFYANILKSFRKYGPSFTHFVPSIGHFVSIALVLNLRSLFGDDLDTSSLGLYYGILGYVCFVNFMIYCFVATHFVKRPYGEAYAGNEEIVDGGTGDQVIEELQFEGTRDQMMEELQNEGIGGEVMVELGLYEVIRDQVMELVLR